MSSAVLATLLPRIAAWRDLDYRAAEIPMLPAVVGAQRTASAVHANTVALVATSLALVPLLGVVYGIAAALAAAAFLREKHALRKHADKLHAWRTFKASGLYLLALLVGLILSTL